MQNCFCRNKKPPLTIHPFTHLTHPSNRISTTKYNALLFLPLVLIVQFKRLANLYFLATAIIQSIPAISPLEPFDSILPLAFVLVVSVIREAVEEYAKYRFDRRVNAVECEVWQVGGAGEEGSKGNGGWVKKKSEDLKVGMVCRVKDGQLLPADMVALRSQKQEGILYLETSGLDGEKALKNRYVPKLLQQLDISQYPKLTFQLTQPTASLHKFQAHYTLLSPSPSPPHPLTLKNFLYRGSKLKNSHSAITLILFTGTHTKTMLNMGQPQTKMSLIERQVNIYMIVIFLIELLLMSIEAVLRYFNVLEWPTVKPYTYTYSKAAEVEAGTAFAGYFILLNTMIPISLIVSIEVIKSIQGYFIDHDELMSGRRGGQQEGEEGEEVVHAQAFRSSLNEELGMIQYVFTDKTGTLTRNQMVMKQLLIGETLYPNMNTSTDPKTQKIFQNESLLCDLQPSTTINPSLPNLFLLCLSLCHECVLNSNISSPNSKDLVYQSTSPDEIALVDTARWLNWVYRGTDLGVRLIEHHDKIYRYEVLGLYEFDSERKRMSVVVRGQQEGVMMVMKGADNVIKQRLKKGSKWMKVVEERVQEFSERGLRTLLFCYKQISEQEWMEFHRKVGGLMEKDKELKDRIVGEMETEMILIGATAVQDRLQDHVPETLRDLLQANIKICMLTGDKLQTAQNIAKSCNLIPPSHHLLLIRQSTPLESLHNCYLHLKQLKLSNLKASLIIEGTALPAIVSHSLFQSLLQQCDSVICCRVTPKDKASVVRVARRGMKKITLAIGDGANDVEMISEANIGVGLYGNEGMSAVQASDYALPEFRGLWRLLFVHGRWNYMRVTDLIKYFFFKNMVFTMPQFFYSFYCGFSGASIYVGLYLSMFNTIFTSLPVVVRAVLQQDINYLNDMDDITPESTILGRTQPVTALPQPRLNPEHLLPPTLTINPHLRSLLPSLYLLSQHNLLFTHRQFLLVNLQSTFCSAVIYFVCQYSLPNSDYFLFSMSVYTCVFFLVTFKLCFQIQYWTWLMVICVVVFSVVPYVVFNLVDSYVESQPTYGTFTVIYSDPMFYLVVIGTSSVVVGISAVGEVLKVYFWPSRVDRARKRMVRERQRGKGEKGGNSSSSSSSSREERLIEMTEVR